MPYTPVHAPGDFARPPTPVLKGYTDIVNSLDAIQKIWDENETNGVLGKHSPPANDDNPFPPTPTDNILPTLQSRLFENDGSKYTQSRASDSSSFGDTTHTPPPEEEDEEEDDEIVNKIVANLKSKIKAVKKRRRLAAEVENLRRELATKEVELKECDRVMALEMGQVSPGRSDSSTSDTRQGV